MKRATLLLTGMTLLGLAALPQVGFAQSDLENGLWQLDLAKSKFSPGPPPKSLTLYKQGEGSKTTVVGITAAGNPIVEQYLEAIADGKPHPVTGSNPNFDAEASTRVDTYTVISSRTKAGKLVAIGTSVVSQDGKTRTMTITGTNADGRQINIIAVSDKQ